MIRSGDSTLHFQKVKPTQLAEIKSVLQKRPAGKVSIGLSPEAQAAMQQTLEETKIQEATKKGKRGSKGSVLFNDTVQIRQEIPASGQSRRASCSDLFEDALLESLYTTHIGDLLGAEVGEIDAPLSPRRCHGRRRSSVSRWIQRRESLAGNSSSVDEVEEVEAANRVASNS